MGDYNFKNDSEMTYTTESHVNHGVFIKSEDGRLACVFRYIPGNAKYFQSYVVRVGTKLPDMLRWRCIDTNVITKKEFMSQAFYDKKWNPSDLGYSEFYKMIRKYTSYYEETNKYDREDFFSQDLSQFYEMPIDTCSKRYNMNNDYVSQYYESYSSRYITPNIIKEDKIKKLKEKIKSKTW